MLFEPLEIDGVWHVGLDVVRDDRGFFARTFCAQEFEAHGLHASFEQSSLSRNSKAGTIRGMHYQADPFAETKLVRCVQGAIFDVALDLRPASVTLGRWVARRLDAHSGGGLYIPPGIAHGFQALEDNTDVLYQISPAYVPGHGAGVRWDDQAFGIQWPQPGPILSPRDASYPDWQP